MLEGEAIMWKTGHSLIKNKMKVEGAAMAGEMSGHIFFADKFFGYDDALYAALRLLGNYFQDRQESVRAPIRYSRVCFYTRN